MKMEMGHRRAWEDGWGQEAGLHPQPRGSACSEATPSLPTQLRPFPAAKAPAPWPLAGPPTRRG